jgi:hypothetical protein
MVKLKKKKDLKAILCVITGLPSTTGKDDCGV